MKRTLLFIIPLFALGVFLFHPRSLSAQEAEVHDLFVDYERVLHIHGLTPTHALSRQPILQRRINPLDTLQNHPWEPIHAPRPELVDHRGWSVGVYDPEMRTAWRNLRPGGINNGAIREGRGFTSSLSTGVYLRYRFLSAAFRPMFIHNQNRSFSLSRYKYRTGRSDFAYHLNNIDTPERFGDRPFWTFDLGPSYLKADYRGFEAGLSNQNRWWGPALHYPILMSNNAPGFWHFFLGTREPRKVSRYANFSRCLKHSRNPNGLLP